MQLSKGLKFTLALVAQVLTILVIILFKMSVLSGGNEVLLKLAPVDPRDPLRGDYMVVNYDISNISRAYFSYDPVMNGDTVYVPLQKTGSYWTAGYGIVKNKPSKAFSECSGELKGGCPDVLYGTNSDTFYIRGTVISGGDSSAGFNDSMWRGGGSNVRISYNIEAYFIPEGVGSNWPMALGGSDSFAKVMISDSGSAVLKQVYVNGKAWPQGGDNLDLAPQQLQPEANEIFDTQGANTGAQATLNTSTESSSWISYDNTNIGYSLKYPAYFILTEDPFDSAYNYQAVNMSLANSPDASKVQVLSFVSQYDTLEEYVKNFSSSGEVSRTTLKVGNYNAFRIEASNGVVTTLIMRPSDRTVFSFILWSSEYEDDYRKIMESLVFN